MLSIRKDDLDNGDVVRQLRFENKLRQYLAKIDGLGVSLRRSSFCAVKSFFESYDMPLKMRRRDWPRGEHLKVVRPVTKAEIRSLLAVSDLHDRAIITFLKDTGLAISDACALRIGHFQEPLEEENLPIPIVGIRKKTRIKFHTFIGPETLRALQVYFDERRRGTQHLDRIGRGVPPETLSEKCCVFRLKTKLKSIPPGHVSKWIRVDLIKRAGLKGISAHSFRRFFETTLENPELGIHPSWIKRMMGHKLTQVERAYSHPSDEQLREAYRKAIPYLRVERRVGEDRLKAMEERLEEKDKRIDRLESLVDVLIDRWEELKKLRR